MDNYSRLISIGARVVEIGAVRFAVLDHQDGFTVHVCGDGTGSGISVSVYVDGVESSYAFEHMSEVVTFIENDCIEAITENKHVYIICVSDTNEQLYTFKADTIVELANICIAQCNNDDIHGARVITALNKFITGNAMPLNNGGAVEFVTLGNRNLMISRNKR